MWLEGAGGLLSMSLGVSGLVLNSLLLVVVSLASDLRQTKMDLFVVLKCSVDIGFSVAFIMSGPVCLSAKYYRSFR